jgi:Protein of unknown function (DUF3071)
MHELRLVAVSEDGSYAVLAVPGRSGRFVLPIDERLRTVARGQFSRLAQYEIEVESPLRPKEIQDRIRAGETAEEIADAAGLPLDRIRRFEGPVLAEREFRAQEAQRATVRDLTDTGPGPRLGEAVAQRLAATGMNPDEVEWDSRKRQDGNWQVQLIYTVAGRLQVAEWIFDPRSKHVTADNDQAARLSLPESDWPADRPGTAGPATATVTPIGSRTGVGSPHHGDQRAEADRSGGRGMPHPSRPILAGAAAASGGRSASQHPGQGRRPGPAAELTREAASDQVAAEWTAAAQSARDDLIAREKRDDLIAREKRDDLIAREKRDDLIARENIAREKMARSAASESAAEQVTTESAAAAPVGLEREDGPDDGDAARREAAGPPEQAETAPRPVRRAAGGRARRSSVPSWDEIMFGNSRQTD